MSHPCAIPACERPANPGQLMCWPHWCRVPKVLNRAIFDTYANLRSDPAAYRAARDAGVKAVVEKESAFGPTRTMVCLHPGCRKLSTQGNPLCWFHR